MLHQTRSQEDDENQDNSDTPMSPVPPPDPGPVFNPKAGMPPAQSPVTDQSQAREEAFLNGQGYDSPPAAASVPDPMQDYLAQQRQGLQKYGLEQQMAVEQAIQKQRTGLGPNLANAGAGFADAIMQGVARAGPSNFQANLQNRQDKTQEGMRTAMEHAQTGKMAQMKQEMELAQMDPESPLSRMAQRTAAPLLKNLGLKDDEIQNMPASLIGEAQSKHLTLEDIRTKAEETRALREQNALLQGESLRLRGSAEKESARHARVEEGISKTSKQTEAAKTLAGRGLFQTLVNAIPFTAGHEATKVLQKQAAGEPDYAPDVMNYAQQHNLTPDVANTIIQNRKAKQNVR